MHALSYLHAFNLSMHVWVRALYVSQVPAYLASLPPSIDLIVLPWKEFGSSGMRMHPVSTITSFRRRKQARITSHHITSHHITSHHITSHHITSHHTATRHRGIISHHITGAGECRPRLTRGSDQVTRSEDCPALGSRRGLEGQAMGQARGPATKHERSGGAHSPHHVGLASLHARWGASSSHREPQRWQADGPQHGPPHAYEPPLASLYSRLVQVIHPGR